MGAEDRFRTAEIQISKPQQLIDAVARRDTAAVLQILKRELPELLDWCVEGGQREQPVASAADILQAYCVLISFPHNRRWLTVGVSGPGNYPMQTDEHRRWHAVQGSMEYRTLEREEFRRVAAGEHVDFPAGSAYYVRVKGPGSPFVFIEQVESPPPQDIESIFDAADAVEARVQAVLVSEISARGGR